jgi:hypothetical protein
MRWWRNNTERSDPAIAKPPGQFRESRVAAKIGGHPGLLRVAHPGTGRLHRAFSGRAGVVRIESFQDVGFHRLMSRLVQNQVSKVELQNAVQAWRKIVKKRVELSVRSDRLRNLKQSVVLAVQKVHLFSLDCLIIQT